MYQKEGGRALGREGMELGLENEYLRINLATLLSRTSLLGTGLGPLRSVENASIVQSGLEMERANSLKIRFFLVHYHCFKKHNI